GLSAEMFEVGSGRKLLGHTSSMHSPGSANRLHKGRARTTRRMDEGELNSSRGSGGFLRAAGILAQKRDEHRDAARIRAVRLRAELVAEEPLLEPRFEVPPGRHDRRAEPRARRAAQRRGPE